MSRARIAAPLPNSRFHIGRLLRASRRREYPASAARRASLAFSAAAGLSGAERVAHPVTQAARMRTELRPGLRVRSPEGHAVGRAHDLAHARTQPSGET